MRCRARVVEGVDEDLRRVELLKIALLSLFIIKAHPEFGIF